MIKVINLKTDEALYYSQMLPKQAVINAYAQSRKDGNTWGYQQYEPLVQEGKHTYSIDDWCVLKAQLRVPQE